MHEAAVGLGSARAKFILIGEHSAVYGKPAIAVPLNNLTLEAEVRANPGGGIRIESAFFGEDSGSLAAGLAAPMTAAEATLNFLGQPGAELVIELFSQIPAQRGLGSSAAAAGAIAHAIADFYGTSLDPEVHYQIVQNAEKVSHGNPSGLDARATNSFQPIWFKEGETMALDLRLGGTFIIADTGIRGGTRQAVSDVRRLREENPDLVNPLLDRLEQLTLLSAEAISNDLPVELGGYLNEAHSLLRELTVSSPELDKLAAAALEAGAYGAKLTGGGQGGCLVVLAKDLESAQEISEALTAHGAVQTWTYETRTHTL